MKFKSVALGSRDERPSHSLPFGYSALLILLLVTTSPLQAEQFDLRLESGSVSSSRNDVRIPGDDGTRFDLRDLTGDGPDPYVRLYGTYDFNDRHALRLTFAPLEVEGTGRLSRDDLGVVPLAHLYGEYRFNDRASLILDVEGAWSPMGRAVDAGLMAEYDLDSGWYARAGYRTLEGGADNDDVYTFAWLHYAQAAIGYRF